MSGADDLWWVPDDYDVWTLATQSGVTLPNGLVSFTVLKTKKVIAMPLEKCLRAVKDQGTPEDLIHLPLVNPASILACVRARFQEQKIYTSIGMVLMSINPFRIINGLYGRSMIKNYENPLTKSISSHVYMVPSRAYRDMCTTGKDQSILISGESGAGKTEATKQCLSFLTEVANAAAQAYVANHGQAQRSEGLVSMADVSERIIAASPILEAFGNAQTLRNPNSSRFGKWMILNFDSFNRIHSASIISYLLEKSRVTQRDCKERNYHIFYQIIRGIGREQLIAWQIDPSTRAHRYLSQGDREAPDLQDGKVYKETFQAFLKMGFSHEEVLRLFEVVMAILQLGDILFNATMDGEGSTIKTMDIVEQVARKFFISPDILSFALCNRSIESGKGKKSVVAVPLSIQKAQETRDSLARFIYDKIFLDIISTINSKSKDCSPHSLDTEIDRGIGLLDIFGFEIFVENSFEQLCINYCNEMLQNHFNYVIFTAEKQLYEQEGVHCETIEFRDNSAVIHEVEASFKSLDEEGRIPRGTSKTWFDKLKRVKSVHILFPTRKAGDIFSVKHYAGNVDYNAIGFLEKNVETLNNDLLGAMASSTDPLIQRVFISTQQHGDAPTSALDGKHTSLAPSTSGKEGAATSNNGNETGKESSAAAVSSSSASSSKRSSSALASKSLSWRFVNQLSALMAMLKKTKSHFIRCIKSNDECAPQKFEASIVYKQLVYSGVFEVVKIQQSGLPCRLPHDEYLLRYRCLVSSSIRFALHNSQELLQHLLKAGFDLKETATGSTMIFYKPSEQRLLETKRETLLKESSTVITRWLQMKTRSYLYRFILIYYKKFYMFNTELDLLCATDANDHFLGYVHRLHRLVRQDMLGHVVKAIEKELSLLDRRVQLIQDGKEQLSTRSVASGVRGHEEVVSRAMELEITSHPIILRCKEVIQKFYRAAELISLVKGPPEEVGESGGDADGTNESVAHVTKRMSVIVRNLRALTSEQIRDGMELLNEMADLVENADIAAVHISSYQFAVDAELKTVHVPLELLLGQAMTAFDSRTGNLIYKQGAEGEIAFRKLRQMLSSLSEMEFKCMDTTLLFEDCMIYVKVMEEFVAIGDARSVQDAVRRYSASRVTCSLLQEQIEEFDKWAEIQLSADTLRALCAQGCVPTKAIVSHTTEGGADSQPSQHATSFVEIEKLADKLKTLAEPSENVQIVIRVASWIVKWRKAFLASDWELLETTVQEADAEGCELFIFDDFPDCIDELSACQWQVIYHGFYQDLVTAITEPVFRLITFETESWLCLVSSLSEELEMMEEIKLFASKEACPKLLELLPLLEKLIQLRSLIYAKETDFAKQMIDDLETSQKETIAAYYFTEAIKGELDSCRQLIQKIELERQLDRVLAESSVKPYDSSSPNEQVKYSAIADLLPSILALQDTLQALGGLSATFNTSLQEKISLANTVLSGWRYLQLNELDNSHNWEDNLKSFQSSLSALKDDLSANSSAVDISGNAVTAGAGRGIEVMSVYQLYEKEFNLIVGEMERRMLVQAFFSILHCQCILGEVDVNVHVDKEALRKCFETFNRMSLKLKASFQIYPLNLRNLAQFSHSVLSLRKYLLDHRDWPEQVISQVMQELSSSPHGGGLEVANINREISLIKEELRARDSTFTLRHALQYIQFNLPPASQHEVERGTALAESGIGNGTGSVVLIDLQPLEEAISLAKSNTGQSSKQLLALARQVLALLTNLLANATEKIDNSTMEKIAAEYTRMSLNSQQIEIIFDRVRTYNFLKSLNDLLVQYSDQPDRLFMEIRKVQQLLKQLPEKFLPWLHTSYLYCYLSDALRRKSWIEIIEVSQELDEYMSSDLQQTLDRMIHRERQQHLNISSSSFNAVPSSPYHNHYADAEKFISICTQYKLAGFQKAIQMKNECDALEAYHRNQSLSPIEALKASLRQEDLANNLYGIGQMRRAGISDYDIANLNQQHGNLRLLWAYDFEVSLLRRLHYSAKDLLSAGYSVAELYRSGYSIYDLYNCGEVEIADLLELGLSLQQLKLAGIPEEKLYTNHAVSLEAIKEIESEPRKLFNMGFNLSDLIQAGFTVTALRGAGFSAMEIYHAGLRDPAQFIQAGFSSRQLAAVFPLSQLTGSKGLTYQELRRAGVTEEALAAAGFETEVEKKALLALYAATHGSQWRMQTHWGSSTIPLRQWYGVTTQKDHMGREFVTAVDLIENGLSGRLPGELALLRRLKRLRLAGNPHLIVNDLPDGLLQLIHENGVVTDILPFNAAPRLLIQKKLTYTSLMQEGGLATGHAALNMMQAMRALPPEDSQQSEKQALVDLYRACHGPKWKVQTNWCSKEPIQRWHGVKVDLNGFVVGLTLPSNNLRGALPESIGSLQHLRVLDLRLNQISGFLPQGLAYCFKLEKVYLQANKLSGSLPSIIEELEELVVLDLRSNLLQGELPYQALEGLLKLKYLGLYSNNLVINHEQLKRLLPTCKIVC